MGTTCRDCEQRALDGLSEHNLARLTLDPYLRPAAVRSLFERQSAVVNAALVQRGRRYLQPSVADTLGVVEDEPAVTLEPFWPRYRSFDGDRQGATLAAGPALWVGLEPDVAESDHPERDVRTGDAPIDDVPEIATLTDDPEPTLGTEATVAGSPVADHAVAATALMSVTEDPAAGDGPLPRVDETGSAAPDSPRRRPRMLVLAAVLALAGAGLIWALTRGDDDDQGSRGASTTVADDAATTSPSDETAANTSANTTTTAVRAATPTLTRSTSTTAGDDTADSLGEDTTPGTSGDTSTLATGSTESSGASSTTIASSPEDAQRWVDLTDGTLYLRGTVPDDATGDSLESVLAAAAGENDVVVEVENAQGSPTAGAAPLVVRNADLFDTGSTTPTEAVGDLVALGLELLAQDPGVTIEVGGHTDDVGEEPRNLELSRARAQAVFDALVEAGADADRLTVRAYGETAPIADNGTEDGRAANRRIELSVDGLFT